MEDVSSASLTPADTDNLEAETENIELSVDRKTENEDCKIESDEEDTDSERTQDNNEVEEKSALLDQKGSRDLYPKITQNFRAEQKTDGDYRPASTESFHVDSPKMERRVGFDGREVTTVTLVTQTDWDWVDEAMKKISAREVKSTIPDITLSGVTAVPVKTSKPEVPQNDITSKPPAKSGSVRDATSRGKTEGTLTSLDTMSLKSPFSMPYNDEYGIPLLDMTSSDDDSSDDDIPKYKVDDQSLLPSIGPPQILQYIRESELEEPEIISTEEKEVVDGELYPVGEDGRQVGIYGGDCEFCDQEIKPFPTLEQQQELPPEELYCCEQYREFVQFATTTAIELEEETQKTKKLIDIKPHGHFGSKKARKAAKERAVQRMRDRELQRRQQEASGLQNYFASGSPSDEVGISKDLGGGGTTGVSVKGRDYKGAGGAAPISYKDMAPVNTRIATTIRNIEVARQMKTINYQLSSQKCLEEGWTVRPPTPDIDENDMMDIFLPEPLDFILASSAKIRERLVIQKFYDNGNKFLTVFPDGTGCVFYPSGYLAVSICKMDAGQFIYVLHDNSDYGRILGVFEPNGHGCCYHPNGNVRLYFDQLDGIELDSSGARRKKWTWKDKQTHVHAPPFQPICIGLNRNLGLRVMTQEYITVTFMAKNRSCRFNVGAKLKLISPENIKPREISDNMIFMEEKAVAIASILDKVSNLLKFPNSPKIDKILPPLRVTNKMHRVEELRSRQRRKRIFPSRQDLEQSQNSSNVSLPAVSVN